MATRAVLALLAFMVAAAAPLAASNDVGEIDAAFQWRTAHGYGETHLTGRAWVLHVPTQDTHEFGMPAQAAMRIHGERVAIETSWQDYRGTPAGLVPSDPADVATADGTVNTDRADLGRAGLDLVAVRDTMRVMVTPLDAEAAPPAVEVSTGVADLSATNRFRAEFAPSGGDGGISLNPTYERQGAAVRAATAGQNQPVTVRGDFTLHLWDLDVSRASEPDRVFRSGVLRDEGVGQTAATPDGITYQARYQLLTLRVSQGELVFHFPDRPVVAHIDPRTTLIHTQGSWDVEDAVGSLNFGEADRSLEDSHLHLDGRFDVHFETLGQGAASQSHWQGTAHHVTVDRSTVDAGIHSAVAASRTAGPWLMGLLAAGGIAMAAVSTFGALRWGQTHPRLSLEDLERALAKDEPAPRQDGKVAQGITDLKEGRAQNVVDAFEAGWSPQRPAAPVEAYILSMAHLQLGDHDRAVHWILAALALYPEFASQLTDNPAFAPIRHDARLRAHLPPEEVDGYA